MDLFEWVLEKDEIKRDLWKIEIKPGEREHNLSQKDSGATASELGRSTVACWEFYYQQISFIKEKNLSEEFSYKCSMI